MKKKEKKWVALFTAWLRSAGLPTNPDKLRERILQLLGVESRLQKELDEAQNTIVEKQDRLDELSRDVRPLAALKERCPTLILTYDDVARFLDGQTAEIADRKAREQLLTASSIERGSQIGDLRDAVQRKDRRIAERDKDVLTLVALAQQLSQMVVNLQERVREYREKDLQSIEQIVELSLHRQALLGVKGTPEAQHAGMISALSSVADTRVPDSWLKPIGPEAIDNAAIPAVPETILAIVEALEENAFHDAPDSGVVPASHPDSGADVSAGEKKNLPLVK